MGFLSSLSSVLPVISSVMPMLQLPLQSIQSYQNYGLQKENLGYQKAIQQQIFNREDTAVQRRVADLRAAGLNPLLAAGSGAGTGSYVPTVAPQITPMDMITPLSIGQNIRESESRVDNTNLLTSAQVSKIEQDIKESTVRVDKTKQEISLSKLQQEFTREDIKRVISATSLLLEQIEATKQKRLIDKEMYDWNRSFGFRSTSPMSEPLQFLMSVVEVFGYSIDEGMSFIDKGASLIYKSIIQALKSTGFIKK